MRRWTERADYLEQIVAGAPYIDLACQPIRYPTAEERASAAAKLAALESGR